MYRLGEKKKKGEEEEGKGRNRALIVPLPKGKRRGGKKAAIGRGSEVCG